MIIMTTSTKVDDLFQPEAGEHPGSPFLIPIFKLKYFREIIYQSYEYLRNIKLAIIAYSKILT